MTDSTREAALKALLVMLDRSLGAWAQVLRNDVLPNDMPATGLVILRDGSPGEPEVTLSPVTWHYEHMAEVEIIARDDATFDAICRAIGTALAADRTVGGTCDWAEPQAPEAQDLYIPGAEPPRAATLAVMLSYSTTDPLN
jgi:hypothetical protein